MSGESAGGARDGRSTKAAAGGGETSRPAGEASGAQSFEQALKRLQEIADRLERGDLDLKDSLSLYREAREMHAFCAAQLSAAEEELRLLLADDRLVPESLAERDGESEG
ncbi:MAG: exodeoxyribonuclease VII small subunit [Candidatus Eisenbacteria bacterium]